jgi:predicted kinase
VAADIAFLAMDLDAHGAPDLADVLLGEYSKYAGDNLAPVLDFYRCYRAYTRGKVASLRAEQAGIGDAGRDSALLEARRYFHLALRYARHERRPRLVLMAGLTGSGKSSLATRLGDILAARVVSSDETRKQLAGLGRWDRRLEAADSGLYAPAMNERVYAAMLAEARCQLTRGRTVILDATYRRRADREAARALAGDLQAGLLTVECAIDDVTVRQRLDARARAGDSWSDGRWEIYLHQKRAFEPLVELLPAEHVTVDTTRPAMTQVDAVLAHLESPPTIARAIR